MRRWGALALVAALAGIGVAGCGGRTATRIDSEPSSTSISITSTTTLGNRIPGLTPGIIAAANRTDVPIRLYRRGPAGTEVPYTVAESRAVAAVKKARGRTTRVLAASLVNFDQRNGKGPVLAWAVQVSPGATIPLNGGNGFVASKASTTTVPENPYEIDFVNAGNGKWLSALLSSTSVG